VCELSDGCIERYNQHISSWGEEAYGKIQMKKKNITPKEL